MIRIVGIGPRREDMTIMASQTLQEADVVIGYGGYIRQIKDLLEGKRSFHWEWDRKLTERNWPLIIIKRL